MLFKHHRIVDIKAQVAMHRQQQRDTKIYIYNKETKVEGDYVLTSLNIPLTYNSMMTFSASKVPARLI